MAGKLKEPRVITDHRHEPVCILPAGFWFDDERWEKIWQRFEEKCEALLRQFRPIRLSAKLQCDPARADGS